MSPTWMSRFQWHINIISAYEYSIILISKIFIAYKNL